MTNQPPKAPVDLTGSDLWDYLTAPKPKDTAASHMNAFPHERAPSKTLDPGWHDAAITLIVQVCTCTHCGSTSRVANPYPLIRREHIRHGTHYHSLEGIANPLSLFSQLPREVVALTASVSMCEACFTRIEPGRLLAAAPAPAMPPESFTLDNPPTDQHRLFNRGASNGGASARRGGQASRKGGQQ